MNKEKAIDLLEDIQWGEGTAFTVTHELAEAAKLAIEEMETKVWIPVTERLPSTSGRFEVTIKGSKGKRHVEICDFQKEAFPDWRWGGRYNTKNVIAWRARPVPYKDK
ncbi:hypothetical protein [Eisenbergiella porci]|uniref:hypothetical protein n=1 Tax=Eisenbergiella porci TaxID=2652274 RepID=UPI002A8348D8|nr:hypothetical protein [Eisenbergiella porci]